MNKENKKKLKKKEKQKSNNRWVIKIILFSFIISMLFTFVSETAIPNINIFLGIFLVIIFIMLGVLFDMIGVAVTASDEAIFHSMASKNVRGAKLAIWFKKNADKVSSFCQDVIGDICGIVSGSTGAVIALKIMEKIDSDNIIIVLITMGLISALTIGGKAIEKGIALNKSNDILYKFSHVLSYLLRRR